MEFQTPTKKLHVYNTNPYFEAGIIQTPNLAGSNLKYIDNTGKSIEIGIQNGDAVIRTNATTRIIAKTGSGNVGIGTDSPNAKLDVYEDQILGSNVNDTKLLSIISGSSSNKVMKNLWLRRDASGSDWNTARLHDGVSVDVSFFNSWNKYQNMVGKRPV